jgi:hypothetical protein
MQYYLRLKIGMDCVLSIFPAALAEIAELIKRKCGVDRTVQPPGIIEFDVRLYEGRIPPLRYTTIQPSFH